MKATQERTEQRLRRAFVHLADATPTRPDHVDLQSRTLRGEAEPPQYVASPRRRAPLVAATAATLMVGSGALAVASGGYLGEDAPGADYRPMADLPEVVRAGGAEIPFAPHRSLDDAIEGWTSAPSFEPDATMSTEGMIDLAADAAVCSWLDQWLTATASGDAVAVAQAERLVAEARDWPWWSLVRQEHMSDQLDSHVSAMEASDVSHVSTHLGLNCLQTVTEAPAIAPTGE